MSSLLKAMYLVAFHGFFRIGELAPPHKAASSSVIQLSQCSISSRELLIRMDVFKHYAGRPVYIAIPASRDPNMCPVHAVHVYLGFRGKHPGPLFSLPGLIPITKRLFTENLNASLAWAGATASNIHPHSFRIGAATNAAAMGIPDDQIQRMGRWKSSAFKRYIRINTLRL